MEELPEKYRYDLAIIRETADQIIRDINIPDFEIIFSGNEGLAFIELKSQLAPQIHRLFNEDKNAFQALLYRIDIEERDYKKAVSNTQSDIFEEKLSELIIRREFQKVITRKYFVKSNDKNQNTDKN